MTHPLSRAPERTRPALTLLDQVALIRGRVHEACGLARRSFAMLAAAQSPGLVLWIAPAWEADQLNPDGMRDFVDPARFLFVHPQRPEDILWTMEEALRSGALPLVVADLPGLPGLTPIRRLHLAAEAGGELADAPPLGLVLTPGDGGAQGVETRWKMSPAHQPVTNPALAGQIDGVWDLSRLRARTAPVRTWQVTGHPGQMRAAHAGQMRAARAGTTTAA